MPWPGTLSSRCARIRARGWSVQGFVQSSVAQSHERHQTALRAALEEVDPLLACTPPAQAVCCAPGRAVEGLPKGNLHPVLWTKTKRILYYTSRDLSAELVLSHRGIACGVCAPNATAGGQGTCWSMSWHFGIVCAFVDLWFAPPELRSWLCAVCCGCVAQACTSSARRLVLGERRNRPK